VEFKTKNDIVSTGGNEKPLLGQQEVAELSSQLVVARAHTAEAKARLDRINAVLASEGPNESLGATVADTLKNEVVSKLRSQYLDLAARESDWSSKYGREHIAVVNLRNQMREIRNSIFQELKRLGETYKSDYEISKQREEGVQKELAKSVSQSQQTDVKSVSLRELQSTAQTYKSLYDNFLQRYMESVQQQSFPITEARLISSASRPSEKSSPKTLLVLAVASFGGIILGLAIGVLRDSTDRVFRTSEQIESLLQMDCIGLVPLLTGDEAGGTSAEHLAEASSSVALVSDLRGTINSVAANANAFFSSRSNQSNLAAGLSTVPRSASKPAGSRTIVNNGEAYWTVVNAPFSRFAEAIRSIRLAVDLNDVVKVNRVIGFTSSLPNEGKSTIAVGLAQLVSRAGKRTIVVDCDLRNPSLSRELAPNAKSGLLEVITEQALLEEVIWTEPSLNLTFLPAVVKSRMANSSEILYSAPMKKLIEQLREEYDYVVVDFPQLAPIVDVHGAAHLVDSFIFVIEWGRTKIDIVEHVLRHAPGVYENLVGVVLNKVDMNLFRRYSAHREGYYFNKHYARYGYTE
jgi:succinoglycan biosynthesis transport protein ExoP